MIDSTLLLSGTLDASNTLTGQALTGTAASTLSLDLGSNRDIGAAQYINFNFLVTEALDLLTSLQFVIQSSADDASFVDLLLSPAILLANLTVGRHLIYTLPRKQLNDPDAGTPNRYLRANYVVAGTNPANGAVACWVTGGEKGDAFEAYPSNFSNAYGT